MEPKTKRERVSAVSTRPYKGFVYNVTTETGNVFVENVLVHNSGGLGTPAHLRVEPGLIHKANGGVLFLDEIATLSMRSQQEHLVDAFERLLGQVAKAMHRSTDTSAPMVEALRSSPDFPWNAVP